MYVGCLVMLLTGCGGEVVQHQKMDGYDRGKRTFIMEDKLEIVTLDNGEPGYKLYYDFRWAVGNRRRRFTTRHAYLKKDYSLYKTLKDLKDTKRENLDGYISHLIPHISHKSLNNA